MNSRLLHGIQKTASRHGSPTTIGGFLNQVMAKHAEDAQTVEETVKSDNRTPSSASGKGMEDRNKGYGHTPVDTDFDKKTGGEETGEVQNRGDNLTTEAAGIPDKSLHQGSRENKSSTEKLAKDVRASRIREKLQKHASMFR